jgi:transmembrane sensor
MKKRNWLKWFGGFKQSEATDSMSLKIENALDARAKKIKSIDPETDIKWSSLRNEIEGRQASAVRSRFIIPVNRRLPAISVAAACTVLVAVGVIWLQRPSSKIYATSKGQHSLIVLQDSTEVILNAQSEISVDSKSMSQARRVSLKGEAMFHVRRNGTPFILTTEVGTVQVLGTEFNVRVRDDRMEVAVISGSVKMGAKKNGIDSSIILTKGQIAVCSMDGYPDTPGSLPFAGYPGWTKGKLMFYHSTLASVCRELERQFDISIRAENPRLRSATVTGMIDGQNPDGAVKTLVQLTGTEIRYENGVYNIY